MVGDDDEKRTRASSSSSRLLCVMLKHLELLLKIMTGTAGVKAWQ